MKKNKIKNIKINYSHVFTIFRIPRASVRTVKKKKKKKKKKSSIRNCRLAIRGSWLHGALVLEWCYVFMHIELVSFHWFLFGPITNINFFYLPLTICLINWCLIFCQNFCIFRFSHSFERVGLKFAFVSLEVILWINKFEKE